MRTVVVLRFLEQTSKYVAPSTMPYYVWRKYGQIEPGLLFRVVAEFVFFGTDLTPERAISSKIFHDKH